MSDSPVQSVVLAGGGTAGHVNPLLAVADELRAREPGAKVLVLGTTTGLEADLVPARGYPLWPVPRVPLPRRPSADLLTLPGKLSAAVKAAEAAIDQIDAQAVVGFGGYVSTPAYLAARRRGVPVVIHEQNARPGLANKLGARWAARVGLTFEGTALRGGVVTGLPLRREIAALVDQRDADAAGTRVAAADALGLDPTRPTLLVTGGSSGALSVNAAVVGAAAELLAAGAQVLHLTGRGKDGPVREALARIDPLTDTDRYHVREYLSEMHHALAVADLVVARSGAGTVCELAALGIPAVYVPLPVGNGEQRLNATPLVRAGGGLLVDDADLTPAWVAAHVPALLADTARLAAMAEAARSTGVRDAAARVADLVEQAVAEAGR
ncbi:undecaprenyldiphospho-muramoylpentapeptide beta-N-acetylglucosaminyltransferase [Xylanimonas protaetiae]|uniref:UDP-N-acetylglucosamine--N-acetylmuramyl-(pentapeptide) pyrophosphoryl-undecaprenol N-acetylglucosamine transferase n=1 Tax=Xylanimonas protaetiae TaxID=2509457 RepID=A0A4P6F4V5_9MICO|nr:undecaprenyldiphospho-muramoylpentapeptide beta-N-acetylglucosaminyltransferase [Xylanimonas protaetiae]QAY70634.1 undecaprenyldiphospho-muramoylpentapeptide beta-N-acetylglucosaminyltransferase [Xylanimonas protaetiae]